MPKRFLAILFNLLLITVLLPVVWVSYTQLSQYLGLKRVVVEVAGTGSMYPSLYWSTSQGGPEDVNQSGVEEYRSSPLMYRYFSGLKLGNQTYLRSTLNYGDMVAFSSEATKAILTTEGKDPNLGFIKRIIGMPGDTIELRDGYVVRSGQLIEEPYLRTPRSTYRGSTLPECRVITIPPEHYFVLGDNRKVSSDSRSELGLVKERDIQFYLPLSAQGLYQPLWRDPSADTSLSGTTTFKPEEFYAKISRLTPKKSLERSASIRGQALLSDPVTSIDLTTSLSRAGYSNIVTGEFVTYGYYTADELWESLQSNYSTRQQLANRDYSDIGLSLTLGEVDGCPTQIVVGHLGGYLPATYPIDVVESWQKSLTNLNDVIPSWEAAVNLTGVDQTKLTALLDILRRRRDLAVEVIAVMEKKEWLSSELKARIDQDSAASAEAERLAQELNSGN